MQFWLSWCIYFSCSLFLAALTSWPYLCFLHLVPFLQNKGLRIFERKANFISSEFQRSLCWSGLGHGVLHCLEACLWLHSGEGNKFLPGKKKQTNQPWKQLLAAGTKMASSWKSEQSLRKSFDEACFIYWSACDINSDFFVLFYLFQWWRNHLHAAGHICVLKDAFMYESPAEVANLTSTEKFDAALAIHLYKGGRLLQGNPLSALL